VVVAPDEARTIAFQLEDEDPSAACQLLELAHAVEELLPQMTAGTVLVAPKITEGDALAAWAERHRKYFRAAYRQAGGNGVVIMSSPGTQSLDDPPSLLRHMSMAVANAVLQSLHMRPEGPPKHGHFYVIATCEKGRFQGTCVAMLAVPKESDYLPSVNVVAVPTFTDYGRSSNN
jgi:hypothetical protein